MINAGIAHVFTLDGREVFTANLLGLGTTPTRHRRAADDRRLRRRRPRRVRLGRGDRLQRVRSRLPRHARIRCPVRRCAPMASCGRRSRRTARRTSPARRCSTSTATARAEVVYGDECFTRVYDGLTGKVLYSRYRTSCTWYENPVIADVDADFNAEIVSTSNTNCTRRLSRGRSDLRRGPVPRRLRLPRARRPASASRSPTCSVAAAAPPIADCGGDGFVCLDPIAGPSAGGQGVPRLAPRGRGRDRRARPRRLASIGGSTRARSGTSTRTASPTSTRPARSRATSAWLQNWKQPELNNFRQNSPGDGADRRRRFPI